MRQAIRSWFFDKIDPIDQNLAYIQVQQAWIRMLLAVVCLVYLYENGPFYATYARSFQATISLYLIYNIYIFYAVRRYPSSVLRILISAILDVYIVSFGLVIDGGNSSGLSLIYLLIIFGNAMRGNMILFYTQSLCLAGLVAATTLSLQQLQINTAWSLLMFQIAALLILPLYSLTLNRRKASSLQTFHDMEPFSLGLLDRGSLPVFSYRLDEHQSPRIIYTNAALQMVSRENITRLMGKQVDMLALLEDGNVIIDQCRRALQQTSNEPFRFFIRGRDTSERILNLMGEATRIRWRSQWVGLCFLFDITEQEKNRVSSERVQRAGYMSTFVAGIVHDFRNVLTSVIGQAEILQMNIDDPKSKHNLDQIILAGEQGAKMTAQLLGLGMGSPNRDSSSSNGKDIRDILENMISLVRLQLPEKVNLSCEIDSDLPESTLPISEIEPIIFNLLQNAYQAIPAAGSIDIRVTTSSTSPVAKKGMPAIVIRVEDTGSGIADEDMDKIFKTFWTTRKEDGGAGLGLAMIKRIVTQNHGHIDVESTPGQGSVFTIHLPSHLIPKQQSTDASKSEKAKSARGTEGDIHTHPWRILLVDDSPIVLQAHLAMLTRMGHQVVSEPDAKSALSHFDTLNEEAFDLILTDYRMPNMDGLQFIQSLRSKGVQTPIMLITAFGEEERLQQLNNLDVGIIHKPVSYRGLSAYIAAVQAGQKLQRPQSQ